MIHLYIIIYIYKYKEVDKYTMVDNIAKYIYIHT